MTTITRFAPSPTGLIHLGNVRTALFSWLLAHKHSNGRFVLRIEDTDIERSRQEYVDALMADLRWLGLTWEAGPGTGESTISYYQSQRADVYAEHYHALEAQDAAYPCYCSSEELEISRKLQLGQGRPPRYAGTCRHLSAADRARRATEGRQPSLRFRVPEGQTIEFHDRLRGLQRFQSGDIGDFIIRRGDGSPAFFFCNALDDALMNINLVLRGEDHLSNTPRQILILEALGLRVPDYGHMPLIVGEDGQPLSKRNGSRNIRDLRQAGYFPEAVNNYLARLGHHLNNDELLYLPALAQYFALQHIGRSPARFDPQQLDYWQRQAMMGLPWERIWQWLDTRKMDAIVPPDMREAFVAAVRANLSQPGDALLWARVCFDDAPISAEAWTEIRKASAELWESARQAVRDLGLADFKALSAQVSAQTGLKGKALFMPLRAALTGQIHGPEMALLLPLMGEDRALARLSCFMEV